MYSLCFNTLDVTYIFSFQYFFVQNMLIWSILYDLLWSSNLGYLNTFKFMNNGLFGLLLKNCWPVALKILLHFIFWPLSSNPSFTFSPLHFGICGGSLIPILSSRSNAYWANLCVISFFCCLSIKNQTSPAWLRFYFLRA